MPVQHSASHCSIFDYVLAPAPRLLMRLALMPQLLENEPVQVRNFLEIGPGKGDLSLYLASLFPQASGLLMDISAPGIEKVQERIGSNARLSAEVGDFRALPQRAVYDLVVACEVFEHIEDDDSAFNAACLLLQPGGYFIFSVPAFMKKWGPADQYAGHFRRYERAELVEKFKQHGFEIKTFWCYGFPLTQILHFIYKFYYGWKVSHQPLSMEEATKRSGTDRSLVSQLSRFPVAKLMWPFFVCQRLVKNTDMGDGYLILARKI